jgi:hypothetical protein
METRPPSRGLLPRDLLATRKQTIKDRKQTKTKNGDVEKNNNTLPAVDGGPGLVDVGNTKSL